MISRWASLWLHSHKRRPVYQQKTHTRDKKEMIKHISLHYIEELKKPVVLCLITYKLVLNPRRIKGRGKTATSIRGSIIRELVEESVMVFKSHTLIFKNKRDFPSHSYQANKKPESITRHLKDKELCMHRLLFKPNYLLFPLHYKIFTSTSC